MPTLTHACIVTRDLARLRSFYETILGPPTTDRPEYVEFRTPSGAAISMYRHEELERYAPGATVPGANRSVMLEFEVLDIDAEFRRLAPLGLAWVMPPTTQPWGNRAAYVRDPDGTLVNLYSRVHDER